jgi:hypothetical protein
MSIAEVMSRVSELTSLTQRTTSPTAAPPQGAFPNALLNAFPGAVGVLPGSAPAAGTVAWPDLPPPTTGPTGTATAQLLAAAESQVGVAEEPPGSNDGPQLALYRNAVAGAQPGQPWCAYFASWTAAQGGTPLGEEGQGYGSVKEIADWGARTGRLLPASATPAPGDLILYGDRHIGIVESVNADGSLTTVEGNYASGVTRVQRSPSEATGYVRP